jgi:phage tail-like protein
MKSRTLVAALLAGAILVAAAIGAWTSSSLGAGAPGSEQDTLTAARFELTVDGHSLAIFSELAGISSSVDIDDVRLDTKRKQKVLKKLPRTPPTVTLRRGMTRNIEMAAWHELVILGDVAAARKNVTLTMYDVKGDPVVRYHLTNAWPSKLEIGALKAGASSVLTETVTLVAEFMQRVSV